MVCHSPGTDVGRRLWRYAVLIEDNLYDKAFVARYVEGFEAFAAEVKTYTTLNGPKPFPMCLPKTFAASPTNMRQSAPCRGRFWSQSHLYQ